MQKYHDLSIEMFFQSNFLCLLGAASACVELGLYEEAFTWCDKGLGVSLYSF